MPYRLQYSTDFGAGPISGSTLILNFPVSFFLPRLTSYSSIPAHLYLNFASLSRLVTCPSEIRQRKYSVSPCNLNPFEIAKSRFPGVLSLVATHSLLTMAPVEEPKYDLSGSSDCPAKKEFPDLEDQVNDAQEAVESDSNASVGRQIELEAGNAIKYRTCSWQKVD